jgi:hypothetical protein
MQLATTASLRLDSSPLEVLLLAVSRPLNVILHEIEESSMCGGQIVVQATIAVNRKRKVPPAQLEQEATEKTKTMPFSVPSVFSC